MNVDHPNATAFEAFIYLYYDRFDNSREFVGEFYDDNAVFDMLGKRVHGRAEIEMRVNSLALSHHSIHSLTCDTIPFDQSVDPNRQLFHYKLLGEVLYGVDQKYKFKRNFVVSIKYGKWTIILDSYSLKSMASGEESQPMIVDG